MHLIKRRRSWGLTYDEAPQQRDAQRDGQGQRLDAALLGRIDASVRNVREDVLHPERQTRAHLRLHLSKPLRDDSMR